MRSGLKEKERAFGQTEEETELETKNGWSPGECPAVSVYIAAAL